METAKRHLKTGFDLLDSIEFRLKGAELDRMALARQEFRQAYAKLEKLSTEKQNGEVNTNG